MNNVAKMSLWKLTWPIALEISSVMFMYSIDVWFLSSLSDHVVAGVGVAEQFIFLMVLLFNVFANGSSMIVAQYLGAGDRQAGMDIGRMGLVINFVVGICFSALAGLVAPYYLDFMNVSNQVYPHALMFLMICGTTIWVQALSFTLSALLRVNGFTRDSMWITIGTYGFHLFCSSAVIFGLYGIPKLGVVGAASSIVFSQLCSVIAAGIILYRRTGLRSWNLFGISWNRQRLKAMLTIGLPSAGEEATWQISQMLLTFIIAKLGTDALATRVYTFNIMLLMMQATIALSMGTSILVGHEIGAGNTDRAYRVVHRSFKLSLIFTGCLCLLATVCSHPLLQLFTNNEVIVQTGVAMLFFCWILEPGRNLNLIYIKALNASGDAKYPMLWAVISMLGINVPLAYLLAIPLKLGLIGVWGALIVDEWLRGILMWRRWRSKRWQVIHLIDDAVRSQPALVK